MASNSDKKLREKLQGHSMPYDPQAWAAMEAMLNKKKKRRGFIWWWVGGVAASLMLGAGVYALLENSGMGEFGNGRMANSSNAIKHKTENENNGQTENGVSAANAAGINEEIEKSVNAGNNNTPHSNGNVSAATSIAQNAAENETTSAFSQHDDIRKVPKKHTDKRNKHNTTNNALALNNGNNNQQQTINHKQRLSKHGNKQLPVVVSATGEAAATNSAVEENPWAAVNADIMQADELPVNMVDDITSSKREEEVLKKKKKIFHYSVGVAANVTGTTLGSQPGNTPERTPLFYNKPSYGVGLTHDFLFVKRIALTNSILFSKTSFKVYSPKSISYDPAPLNYTSNITEVAIPVGVKVYPVNKRNFRFYISMGITNHIKVAESFSYSQPVADNTNPAAVDKSVLFPTETSFDGVGNGVSQLGNAFTPNVIDVRTNTNDFSINNAKRYYASFYAGAGVEGIIKNHWLLFAEPTFSMTIPQIGVQEKRKYNVGVSGGFRYQF